MLLILKAEKRATAGVEDCACLVLASDVAVCLGLADSGRQTKCNNTRLLVLGIAAGAHPAVGKGVTGNGGQGKNDSVREVSLPIVYPAFDVLLHFK